MQGAAFPRRLRLQQPAQFQAVFDGAELRISSGELLLLARGNQLLHPRLGIVIGRKVCPRATRRNRVKRLIRETYRQRQAELEGLDIIVLARGGIAALEPPALLERITGLWTRLLNRRNRP